MRARVHVVSTRLDVDVGHATRTWSGRTAITVRLHHDALVGEGEAVPLEGYSPDRIADVTRALSDLDGTELDLDDEAPSTLPPSARAALVSACLDLRAKQRGLPLHAYLGGGGGAVPISTLLPIDDATTMHAALDDARARGIACFKVKIGASIDAELRAITDARARHPEASIRADANGALPLDDVPRVLGVLADLGVVYVEEPVPLASLETIPRWPLPVALDESLARLTRDQRTRWLDSGALGALVLKPSLLGGLDRALALAHVAASHGVGASASHLFDGPIGLAGAAELALALPRPLPAGVAPHGGLAAFAPRAIAALDGAALRPHRVPGLGLGAAS